MGRVYHSFNSRRRSPAQKSNLLAARDQLHENRSNRPEHRSWKIAGTSRAWKSSSSCKCKCHNANVDALLAQIRELRRRLHNVQRQFRRAEKSREKSRVMSLASARSPQEPPSLLSVSTPSPSSPSSPAAGDSPAVVALRQTMKRVHKQNDAIRKRLARNMKGRSRELDRAIRRAKVSTAATYFIKANGAITPCTRALIRSLVEFGIPFKHVLAVIKRVLHAAQVRVVGQLSDHSTRRIVLEGGVFANLQIADEITQTQSLTISGDGTTFKDINLEAAFMTYKVPSTGSESDSSAVQNTPQLRFLPIAAATSHTSEAQLRGWQDRLERLCATYNRSPLGTKQPISLQDILRKTKGMMSDHANDQKSLAFRFEQWKREIDREARGEEAVLSMDVTELLAFQNGLMEQCLDDVGGYQQWDSLLETEKQQHTEAAYACAIRAIGQDRFTRLSLEERRWSELFLWAGCGMHKEMNAVKWGAREMEAFWTTEQAKELGAPPPFTLHNKDNAAAAADATSSTARARAEQVSSRGAVKTAALAGAIFRNKYEKKGQQDSYRWFFAEVLGYMIQFPDTSNTRYGSYCNAASELLVHLAIYIQFLELVRQTKEKGDFNHMEQNVYDALHDASTLTELAALSLYSQAISQPYAKFIRNSMQNALDLGPYHSGIIQHCQCIIEQPDLLLCTDSDSFKRATLDRGMWDRPEAVYAAQRLYQEGRLPYLRQVLVAFFKGAVIGWTRFISEFAPGGRIDSATAEEREAAFMRTTNCHSEGALGAHVSHRRDNPSMALSVWNAKTMHKQNGTAEWIEAHQTPELSKFVTAEARNLDTSGVAKEMRRDHVAQQKEKATAKEKQREDKAARDEVRTTKLEAIEVHLDPEYWDKPTQGRKITIDEIKAQLSWLRAPARKQFITVPTGLSGGKKAGMLLGLISLLKGLDATNLAALEATRVPSAPGLVQLDGTNDILAGEQSLGSDEEN